MKNIILEVIDLSVALKSTNQQVLKNISFTLYENDVLSLSGRNGSGKSTFIKVLMGNNVDYKIDSGKIIFKGKDILTLNDKELGEWFRSKVAYVGQKDDYRNFKARIIDWILDAVRDNEITKEDIVKAFDDLNLREYDSRGKLSFSENSICNEKLSGGQQRLVSVLIALLARPNADLFIIDEPLNNLDFRNAAKISNLLNNIHRSNNKAAMIIVTHCKIFTCINKVLTLTQGEVVSSSNDYCANNCIGDPDENGYYEI